MSIYNSSSDSDDDKWKKILIRDEVLGYCRACGRKNVYALRTIFADHSETLRCKNCNAENQFEVGDDYYDDANRWKPLGGDEDDNNDKGSGRYTRGKRY